MNYSKTIPKMSTLPAINVAQQLFQRTLPECNSSEPQPCCTGDANIKQWINKTPNSMWNAASPYTPGGDTGDCTDIALARQGMLSQYFAYLSGNKKMP